MQCSKMVYSPFQVQQKMPNAILRGYGTQMCRRSLAHKLLCGRNHNQPVFDNKTAIQQPNRKQQRTGFYFWINNFFTTCARVIAYTDNGRIESGKSAVTSCDE